METIIIILGLFTIYRLFYFVMDLRKIDFKTSWIMVPILAIFLSVSISNININPWLSFVMGSFVWFVLIAPSQVFFKHKKCAN